MPVCLHCGELAPEGALFCVKCGYTLPQVGAPAPSPTPASVPPAAPAPMGYLPPPPPSFVPPPRYAPMGAPVPYAVPVPPGAVGPIPAPPSGKYCVHCRAIIAAAAAYCPVCQRPQP